MRITVIGASAGTGREVVEQAVARGHKVVAVSRRGCDVDGAVNVPGDALDPRVLSIALHGCEAVVICVGGAPDDDRFRTRVTRAVIDTIDGRDVRLVVESSLGVGESARLMSPPARFFGRSALKRALADHADQEAVARVSGLRYTIVRPGNLTDHRATGRVSTGGPGFVPRISRADVAAFILDAIEEDGADEQEFNVGSGTAATASTAAAVSGLKRAQ